VRVRARIRSILSFVPARVRYELYPLIVLRPAMALALYNELTRTFPTPDIFTVLPQYDYQLSLSEKFALQDYNRFLAQNSTGIRFYSWIKSDEFIAQTAAYHKIQHIDLELDRNFGSVAARLVGAPQNGNYRDREGRLVRRVFSLSTHRAAGGPVSSDFMTPS
jgi:hypothetical protein